MCFSKYLRLAFERNLHHETRKTLLGVERASFACSFALSRVSGSQAFLATPESAVSVAQIKQNKSWELESSSLDPEHQICAQRQTHCSGREWGSLRRVFL